MFENTKFNNVINMKPSSSINEKSLNTEINGKTDIQLTENIVISIKNTVKLAKKTAYFLLNSIKNSCDLFITTVNKKFAENLCFTDNNALLLNDTPVLLEKLYNTNTFLSTTVKKSTRINIHDNKKTI